MRSPQTSPQTSKTAAKKRLRSRHRDAPFLSLKLVFPATKSFFTRNGATQFFISHSCENHPLFRATIKPAYQGRFSIIPAASLSVYSLPFRSAKRAVKTQAEISSNQSSPPLAPTGGKGFLFAVADAIAVLICLRSVQQFLEQEYLEQISKKESIACHSFPPRPPF